MTADWAEQHSLDTAINIWLAVNAVNTCHAVTVFGGINVFDCLGMNKERKKRKKWSNKEEVEKGGERRGMWGRSALEERTFWQIPV